MTVLWRPANQCSLTSVGIHVINGVAIPIQNLILFSMDIPILLDIQQFHLRKTELSMILDHL